MADTLTAPILESISPALLSSLVFEASLCVYAKNISGEYIYVNQCCLNLLQIPEHEIIGKTDRAFFRSPQIETLLENDKQVLEFGETVETEETNYIHTTDEIRVFRTVKRPIKNDQGVIVGLFGVSTDVTDLHSTKEQLARQVSIDDLTGLYNRRYFFEIAAKEYSKSVRHITPCSLMVIDIDYFKTVNDRFGHPTGDTALKHLAEQLGLQSRKEDVIARLGGEEFAILLPNTSITSAIKVAEKVRKSICQHTFICDLLTELKLTVSIGITSLLSTDTSFADLYRRADKALYKAKEDGRNRTCYG